METRQILRPLRSSLSRSAAIASSSSTSASSCSPSSSPFSAAARTTTASSSTSLSAAASSPLAFFPRRHQSTSSRTKRRLNIAPHPDFLPPPAGQTHVIYNPPAAAPSVYHTPFKFLPTSDPRRLANLTQMLRSSADVAEASTSPVQSPVQSRSQSQSQSARPSSSNGFGMGRGGSGSGAESAAADSATASGGPSLPPPVAPKIDLAPKKYHVTREQVDEMRALRDEDPARWSVVRLAERYGCTKYFVLMCCRWARPEHRQAEAERLAAVKARWGPIRQKAREDRRKRKALLLKDLL